MPLLPPRHENEALTEDGLFSLDVQITYLPPGIVAAAEQRLSGTPTKSRRAAAGPASALGVSVAHLLLALEIDGACAGACCWQTGFVAVSRSRNKRQKAECRCAALCEPCLVVIVSPAHLPPSRCVSQAPPTRSPTREPCWAPHSHAGAACARAAGPWPALATRHGQRPRQRRSASSCCVDWWWVRGHERSLI